MKFAPIVPTNVLPLIDVGQLSGYHMVLGQYLIRDAFYRDTYQALAKKGHFIIVDNGAAEQDTPPFEHVVAVANSIDADEIVLPDVLRDRLKTLELTMANAYLVPPRKRMVIPQGDSLDEWRLAFSEMSGHLDFASVGIPKHLERFEGGRATLVRWLTTHKLHLKYNIHLFGVWDHSYTEIAECLSPRNGVRGIDTGAPVAQAQAGCLIDHSPQPRQSLDWTMDLPSDARSRHDLSSKVAYNISKVGRWCAGV